MKKGDAFIFSNRGSDKLRAGVISGDSIWIIVNLNLNSIEFRMLSPDFVIIFWEVDPEDLAALLSC
jgi:hypothetical protein